MKMMDLRNLNLLQIEIAPSGDKVWVNGDLGCMLRAYDVRHLVVTRNGRTLFSSDRKGASPKDE